MMAVPGWLAIVALLLAGFVGAAGGYFVAVLLLANDDD